MKLTIIGYSTIITMKIDEGMNEILDIFGVLPLSIEWGLLGENRDIKLMLNPYFVANSLKLCKETIMCCA